MPAPFDDDARRPTSLAEVLRVARAWLQGGWRAAHDIGPDFWRNLKLELLAGRQWFDRAVVLAFAAATGAIVVGFTLLAEAAIRGYRQVESWGEHGPYLTLLWTPALTVALLWWTRRYVPGALGSGITQVVRSLDDDLQPSQRDWLASMRVSMHKIGLVSGGLLAGLSIGRWRCSARKPTSAGCACRPCPGHCPPASSRHRWPPGAGIGHDVAPFMGKNQELAAMLPLPPPTEPRQGKT